MSENEVEQGIRPFGVAAEEAGLVMASPAQTALVTLVMISALRVLPYRIWRYSHIGLFLPFAFSAWHALTAVRPSGLFDLTGWWLWGWSIVGTLAFLYRILIRRLKSPLLQTSMVGFSLISNPNTRVAGKLRSLDALSFFELGDYGRKLIHFQLCD
jgi:predicted ferric reductase